MHEDNPPVTTVRFSPNGRYLLAFTLDNCVRLWDYVSGMCLKTYQGHVNEKYSIGGAFGEDRGQSFVVAGSEDGSILIWDVCTKAIVQKLQGHDGCVLWVDSAPHPNGNIVSAGLDGTIRIWADTQLREDSTGVMQSGQFVSHERNESHEASDQLHVAQNQTNLQAYNLVQDGSKAVDFTDRPITDQMIE